MADAVELEIAINKARGAASVLQVVLNHLADDESDNWKKLGIKRWLGHHMLLMMESERDALEHAIAAIGEAVDVIDATFQAMRRSRA